jgi:hypothetical protein
LDRTQSDWDKGYSAFVAEASKRGLTIDACRQLLASPSPSQNSPPSNQNPSPPSAQKPSHSYPLLRERGVINGNVLGCTSKDTFERFGRLVIARDMEAANKFASAYILNGQCRDLNKGTQVIVEELPFFSDNFCVRPAGEMNCFWTNKGWVDRM